MINNAVRIILSCARERSCAELFLTNRSARVWGQGIRVKVKLKERARVGARWGAVGLGFRAEYGVAQGMFGCLHFGQGHCHTPSV